MDGVVSVVAGNGSDGGEGIPGPAPAAGLGTATQFTVAPSGDIFVSNGYLDVLKISDGQVSVFGQLDPQGGPGSRGVVVAPDGSVYVATPNNVRKFATDGSSTVVMSAAGAGVPTSLGPIAIDPTGNVYVADGSPRITRIAPDGSTTVVAGTTSQAPANTAPGDGGPAVAAALGVPTQLAIDGKGNLLIADSSAHRVRQVAPDGTITTIAGGGATKLSPSGEQYAPDGTKPTDLELAQVSGVAVDSKGRVYVADAGSQAIFRFVPGSGIELVAGSQHGSSETPGLPANQTRVTNVGTLAFDTQGDLFFLESHVIRRIAGAGS